jgi:KAP family P-loop domain
MTIADTKATLEKLLERKEGSVIALSGKWGTGKTHLWKDIQERSKDPQVRKAAKVSLFGVRSIGELKLRAVQECVPYLKEDGTWNNVVRRVSSIAKAAKALSGKGALVDELALLAAPYVLSNKLIILDDVERKHSNLSVDEVFGFIDDCTQAHQCRVLLILNVDGLSQGNDKELWEKFREKVIEYEISIDTSPEEAFDIAATIAASRFSSETRAACVVCGITNIRILVKIIRAVNRLFEGYQKVHEGVTGRMIPSMVLISGIYYKGLDDSPDIEFVLGHGSIGQLRELGRREQGENQESEKKSRAKWETLLARLGISTVNEFEPLFVDFLKSGLLDDGKVKGIVSKYVSEKMTLERHQKLDKLLEDFKWSPEKSDAMLVSQARELFTNTDLAPGEVTLIHSILTPLDGGPEAAEDLIKAAVEKIRRDQSAIPRHFRLEGLHPALVAEIENANSKHVEEMSLGQVIETVLGKRAWGYEEESVLRGSTPQGFESTIRSLKGEGLKLFMLRNIDLYINRVQFPRFGNAMANFLIACQSIVADQGNPRLAFIIRDAFRRSDLAAALEPEGG